MYKISKTHAAHALQMEMLHRLQEVKQKIDLFERKYSDFTEFAKRLKSQEEDFERWDDYMEWKACRNEYQEISQSVLELKRADVEIA